MTQRSEFEHRKRELQAAAIAKVANKALSRKTTGLDKLAKRVLAKQMGAGDTAPDPELEHPEV
ncbi:MAG: hypothetical protein WCO88_13790 [Actinomycetota bacterium]|jgi:hypothetical protein